MRPAAPRQPLPANQAAGGQHDVTKGRSRRAEAPWARCAAAAGRAGVRAPARASRFAARRCLTAPRRRRPRQDSIQQLHNTLKSSDALLAQHQGALGGVLAELDPVAHSLGYLYLL